MNRWWIFRQKLNDLPVVALAAFAVLCARVSTAQAEVSPVLSCSTGYASAKRSLETRETSGGLCPKDQDAYLWDIYSEEKEAKFDVLDPRTTRQVELEYSNLVREREQKEHHELTSYVDDKDFFGRVMGFAKYVFRHIVQYQTKESIKRIEKKSEHASTISTVRENVTRVVKGAAHFELDDTFEVRVRSDLPERTAGVTLKTPLVDAELRINYKGQEWRRENMTNSFDEARKSDRYQLSVMRQLPLDLQSSVNYGTHTSLLTSTLTQRITPHLSLSLSDNRLLNSDSSGYSSASLHSPRHEQSLRFDYGVQF